MAAHSQGSVALARHLVVASSVFAETMQDLIMGPKGIAELERFANNIEVQAQKHGRDIQAMVKDDENALTDHAVRMRSIAAQTVLLRDGLVPALKIDREHGPMRQQALQIMAYLHSQVQAMEMGMH